MKTRECPACAMDAPVDESECPFCGYEFPPPSKSSPSMAILFILLMLAYPLYTLLNWLMGR